MIHVVQFLVVVQSHDLEAYHMVYSRSPFVSLNRFAFDFLIEGSHQSRPFQDSKNDLLHFQSILLSAIYKQKFKKSEKNFGNYKDITFPI